MKSHLQVSSVGQVITWRPYLVDTAYAEAEGATLDSSTVHIITDKENEL